MSTPADHYGEAERELALARERNLNPASQWQAIARAAVHAVLALVDALDDAGGSNRP